MGKAPIRIGVGGFLALAMVFFSSPPGLGAPAKTSRKTLAVVAQAKTVVSGTAGDALRLRVPRKVLMNNAGFDSHVAADRGAWEGVLLVADGSPRRASTNYYFFHRLRESFRCPGLKCPAPRATDLAD